MAKRPLGLALTAILAALILPAAADAGGIDEAAAVRSANRDAKVLDQREKNRGLIHSAALVDGSWEVSYFAAGERVALVIVDPATGEVRESWTGHQVAWKMARGYSGAFGHKLNAPYVFLPLCALFLVGLLDWRRPWRIANLDLLVLLGFGLSHFFFNRGEIGLSVPLQYPPLLYLLARALWIGFRGRSDGIRPVWPATWLLIAALFLIGFRIGLNAGDSGTIDVGYASVVGADRIAHGEPIYDNFPEDVSQGDTYGPVNYLAYTPFELVWPWSGSWDDLPAAHGAAVGFDLATFGLLILLGRRASPGPRGQQASRDPRLRLGRLSVHGLRPRVELKRHPGRHAARGNAPGAGKTDRPWSDAGPGDAQQVRPSVVGANARNVPARGSCRRRGPPTPSGS